MRIENLKKQNIIYSMLPRLSLFFVFSVVLSQFVFSENSENIKSTESFSLEQAINLAVQNNYEIKKQRYALAAAQAQYRQAKGQLDLEVGAEAGYSLKQNPVDEDDPDYGFSLLRVVEDEDGNEVFESIDDEDELQDVYERFMVLLYDDEDEEDE